MDEIPPDDLEQTRAALAPTLDAAAAILPWVAKPAPPRFDPKLNARWISAGKHLADTWSNRHGAAFTQLRPAIFAVYALALESGDPHCLRLGEAFACAADRLEDGEAPSRLIAALTGAIDILTDPAGLELKTFGERAEHYAARLESTAREPIDSRSSVIDHIFINEAGEQVEAMRDALAALPPDAYALTTEASKLAYHAEQLELWGIMHLARQFGNLVSTHVTNLDAPLIRNQLDELLKDLRIALDGIIP